MRSLGWYHYLVPRPEKESLFEAEGLDRLNGRFVVSFHARSGMVFRSFADPNEYLECWNECPVDNRCFFEVILEKQRQKLYFDIEPTDKMMVEMGMEEIDLEMRGMYPYLISAICTVFYEMGHRVDLQNIMLLESNAENKRSYHVIVDGLAVHNNRENKELAEKVYGLIPEPYNRYIDMSVYNKNRQFRLPGCTKLGKGRFLNFIRTWECLGTVIDHSGLDNIAINNRAAVTYTKDCVMVTEEPVHVIEPVRRNDEVMLGIDSNMARAIMSRVNQLIWEVFEPKRAEGQFIPLVRKRVANCKICERRHESDNAYLLIDAITGNVKFYCWRDEKRRGRVEANIHDMLPTTIRFTREHVERTWRSRPTLKNETPDSKHNRVPCGLSVHARMKNLAAL